MCGFPSIWAPVWAREGTPAPEVPSLCGRRPGFYEVTGLPRGSFRTSGFPGRQSPSSGT